MLSVCLSWGDSGWKSTLFLDLACLAYLARLDLPYVFILNNNLYFEYLFE
jgi:hypothetical protein